MSGPTLDTTTFMAAANQPFDPNTIPNLNADPTLSSPFPTQNNTQQWDMGMTPSVPGNMDWSQMPQTLQSQFAAGNGDTGLALGSGTGAVVAEGAGQENSDEYWNALIDGVCAR